MVHVLSEYIRMLQPGKIGGGVGVNGVGPQLLVCLFIFGEYLPIFPEITRLAREGGKPRATQAGLFEQE
jgi:hypothetical protein